MISNFTINQETKEVSGSYDGEEFTLPPKLLDNNIVALTEQECEETLSFRKECSTRLEQNMYKGLRLSEYPPIGDQLDALWKGGEAAAEMLALVQEVKNKYPKPE